MERTQILKYLHNPADLNEETLVATKSLTIDFPWFQTGWMLYLKNLKTVESPEFEVALKKVALLVPDRKQLYKFLNDEIHFEAFSETPETLKNVYSLREEKTDFIGDSLIDKFLRSDRGSFKRNAHQQETQETVVDKHLIEKSVIENDELVTETLANIYFEQKKYEKALSAYQKLSLKYPEKSIYFASRIKEIEVIKNNN